MQDASWTIFVTSCLYFCSRFTFGAVNDATRHAFHVLTGSSASFSDDESFNDCRVSSDWLKCSGPKLPDNFSDYARLEWILRNRTSLDSQDFVNSKHLIELKIIGDELTYIVDSTFETMDRLINLTIKSRNITHGISNLRGLDNLERLDLADNQIFKLDDVIPSLTELANLRYLSLANNRIANAPEETVELMAGLSEVDLTGNPLRCDCGLKPLRPYILDYRTPKRQILYVRTDFCHDPDEKRGMLVAKFLIHIHRMHCLSIKKSVFTVCFFGSLLLAAGVLAGLKEGVRRLRVYLNHKKKSKEEWIRKELIASSGLQAKTPLLAET